MQKNIVRIKKVKKSQRIATLLKQRNYVQLIVVSACNKSDSRGLIKWKKGTYSDNVNESFSDHMYDSRNCICR